MSVGGVMTRFAYGTKEIKPTYKEVIISCKPYYPTCTVSLFHQSPTTAPSSFQQDWTLWPKTVILGLTLEWLLMSLRWLA